MSRTVCAVSNGVLCCNFAESKSVLKICNSKHCHEVTGFLLWIGTYCISCLVRQRSRVKDLSLLVGYDDRSYYLPTAKINREGPSPRELRYCLQW